MSYSGDEGRARGAAADRLMVTFARRTHSGRYISYSRDDLDRYSRDDLDSELGNSGDYSPDHQEFQSYHVRIPATPNNQPTDPAISARV
jgi:cellulose synthase-like protein